MVISFFYCSMFDVQRESGSQPNGHSFCPMSNVQWVSGNQVMPNGHLFYCPMLMPSLSCFFVVFFVLLLDKFLCCIVMFIFFYYLLTYLVFSNLQKNSKKKKVSHKCSLLFYFAFWYGLSNFGFVILRSLKGGLVEILARSSTSPGFQTKANFKVTASR